eukprot:TRINITY_DN2095_c0_g3_i1.p1 TRINITY_DN2095_c0_g3~~TRINITY_DN2095_c0_g3_i1.p1  ORF type:complete len:339 (-),score=70.10 TRINITY_DN2095_c0_g3_i1:68-1084(-)
MSDMFEAALCTGDNALRPLLLRTVPTLVHLVINNRHYMKSNSCFVCNEVLMVTAECKVNIMLKDIIKEKYPEATKKRSVEAKEKERLVDRSRIKKARYLCISRPLHFIPGQTARTIVDVEEQYQLEQLKHLGNKIVALTDLKDEKGGFYGVIADVQLAGLSRNLLIFSVAKRVVASGFTEVQLGGQGKSVRMCEVEEISDKLPDEEAKQNELIEEAIAVRKEFLKILDNAPEPFIKEIGRIITKEPKYNENANIEAKLGFATAVSFDVAYKIGAEHKYPFILYTTDPLQRLSWCKRMMLDSKDAADLLSKKGGYKEMVRFAVVIALAVVFLVLIRVMQ